MTKTDNVSATMLELFDAIGENDAITLVCRLGGARIYCNPAADLAGNSVAMAIGDRKALKLFEFFTGEMIDLPTRHDFRDYRDQYIRDHHLKISATDLALKFSITRRQVFNIFKSEGDSSKPKAKSSQGELL